MCYWWFYKFLVILLLFLFNICHHVTVEIANTHLSGLELVSVVDNIGIAKAVIVILLDKGGR